MTTAHHSGHTTDGDGTTGDTGDTMDRTHAAMQADRPMTTRETDSPAGGGQGIHCAHHTARTDRGRGDVSAAYPPPRSTYLDVEAIADVINDGLEESQRGRGVTRPTTTWWDAARAAELLLFHITDVTSTHRRVWT